MNQQIAGTKQVIGPFARTVGGRCLALTLASLALGGCAAATGAPEAEDQARTDAPVVAADAVGARAPRANAGRGVSGSDPLTLTPWAAGDGNGAGAMTADSLIVGKPFPIPVRPPIPVLTPLQAIRRHAKQFIHPLPADASPSAKQIAYYYGLDYGLGIDSPSGTTMNLVATGTPSAVPGAGGGTMSFHWDEVTTQEDLMSHLGISADASGSIGLFSASAKMSFAKDCTMNSSSVFAILDIQVTNAFQQIVAPGVSTDASNLESAGNMNTFQGRYGDRFVRGLLTGGSFFGVVEIQTQSEQDKQDIESTVSGAYAGVGSASVSLSDSFQKAIQNHSVHVSLYTEGGTPPTPLPTDAVSLMNAANQWLPTVANKGAVYLALVDSDSILPLPNPPTYIDLQNQLQVLTDLSVDRNSDIQTTNDIAYVKNHPNEFVNRSTGAPLGTADFNALNTLQNQVAQDMNTITAAADTALNNPKAAAEPTLVLPPPVVLPVKRVAGGIVAVPNLFDMYPPDADNLLKSVGLVDGGGTVLVNNTCDDGNIWGQTPAAGTLVPTGTAVHVTWCRNPTQE